MKKKKFRGFNRSLSVILACVTAMTFFCACSKQKDTVSSSQAESSSQSEFSAVTLPDSSSSENQTPSDITPAMWEVTDKKGSKITLMGSMHALKDTDYPLPKKITDAFNNADIYALECDPSDIGLNEQSAILEKYNYKDGEKIKDVLSQTGFKGLVNQAKLLGIDFSTLETMRPWAVSNVIDGKKIEKSGLNAQKGIDRYFLGQAKNTGKEIYQVETAKFQYDLLMNSPDTVYDIQFMTGANAKSVDELTKPSKDLYTYWRTGNTVKAQEILESDEDVKALNLTEEQKKSIDKYNEDMLYKRNKTMEKSVKDLLEQKKKVFFVVGLAHFLGDEGIIELLKKDGYKVSRIKY